MNSSQYCKYVENLLLKVIEIEHKMNNQKNAFASEDPDYESLFCFLFQDKTDLKGKLVWRVSLKSFQKVMQVFCPEVSPFQIILLFRRLSKSIHQEYFTFIDFIEYILPLFLNERKIVKSEIINTYKSRFSIENQATSLLNIDTYRGKSFVFNPINFELKKQDPTFNNRRLTITVQSNRGFEIEKKKVLVLDSKLRHIAKKLFDSEMTYQNELYLIVDLISSDINGDCRKIFGAIDRSKKGFLTISQIFSFLSKRSSDVKQSDINVLFIRLGNKFTSKLSFRGFDEMLFKFYADPDRERGFKHNFFFNLNYKTRSINRKGGLLRSRQPLSNTQRRETSEELNNTNRRVISPSFSSDRSRKTNRLYLQSNLMFEKELSNSVSIILGRKIPKAKFYLDVNRIRARSTINKKITLQSNTSTRPKTAHNNNHKIGVIAQNTVQARRFEECVRRLKILLVLIEIEETKIILIKLRLVKEELFKLGKLFFINDQSRLTYDDFLEKFSVATGFSMSLEQLKILFERLQISQSLYKWDGFISLQEFVDLITTNSLIIGSASSENPIILKEYLNFVFKSSLKLQVLRTELIRMQESNLKDLFNRIDHKQHGYLSLHVISSFCSQINFSQGHIQVGENILRSYGVSKIGFRMFKRLVSPLKLQLNYI